MIRLTGMIWKRRVKDGEVRIVVSVVCGQVQKQEEHKMLAKIWCKHTFRVLKLDYSYMYSRSHCSIDTVVMNRVLFSCETRYARHANVKKRPE
jgi:hypothetical protein